MMLTPLLYWLAERADVKKDESEAAEFDVPEDDGHDVIIAGNGRVGQVIGRLLAAAGKPFTALERDMALLGAQRHAKVAGIFVRLSKRDGKPIYLGHIPRVLRLLSKALEAGELAGVRASIEAMVPGYQEARF